MRLFRIIIMLFFISNAVAHANALFENAPTGDTLNITSTGNPAILIEKEQTEIEQKNFAESLPSPKWNTDTQIPITTPFGHNRTASYINHITDFVAFVTLLDSQTIQVEETIQLINTDANKKFQWTLPQNAKILAIFEGKQEVTPLWKDNTLTINNPLTQGVNQFTLRYLIQYPTPHNYALTNIFIPISGTDIPLMIERFSIILNLPQKMTLYANDVLFGQNNQIVPDQVLIKPMGKDFVYQMTHPLPAYTSVKLHIELDTNQLTTEKETNSNLLIVLSYTLIMLLYIILSLFSARHKRWKKILTTALKIGFDVWGAKLKKSRRIFPYVKSFFRLNYTYIIEVIFLLFLTRIVVQYFDMTIPIITHIYMIAISIISLFIIDKYGTTVAIQNLRKDFYTFLMCTPQGLNLTGRIFQSCYQLAICLGFEKEWQNKLIQNNPAYQTYFQEVKKS